MKQIVFIIAVFLSSSVPALTDKEKDTLLQYIKPFLNNEVPALVRESEIPGLYVVLYGSNVFYVSENGRYVFEKSSMIDLKERKDLTEDLLSGVRKKVLAELDEKNMVVYIPEKTKHTITVFTDIDCPYCQKFHRERANLLKNGVRLRYLVYPRAGVDSKSYETAVSVLCSKNREEAMTKAKKIAAENGKLYAAASKNGKKPEYLEQIKAEECNSPVREHMETLHKMGLAVATPQIVFSDGNVVPGYLPSEKLVKMLNEFNAAEF